MGGGRRGEEGEGVRVAFSRLMRCLSWADRERGGGMGLLLGRWGEDSCVCVCVC